MESCLYEGVVHHERFTPVSHRFEYRLFMAYVDLAELPVLLRTGVIARHRFAPASFLRQDHFGDPQKSLVESVREAVLKETGIESLGPIRVLTQLRCFGYFFCPLAMYFCFAPDRQSLQAVVSVVQNTPWLERHAYVLWHGNREKAEVPGSHRHAKVFHVSPFMGMDIDYRWRLQVPGDTLNIAIENSSRDQTLFRAGLHMERRPFHRSSLRRVLLRHPFMTARITASIYYQAFQLWRKKCPFYPHPKHQPQAPVVPNAPGALESSNASGGMA